ncbi:MAG: proton-conducting transporter membrane subunit [Planctomycetota bacterium]
MQPTVISDAEHGTKLFVGFRIDSLSAIMFVMVTFVASLIHLFSSGYMADELQLVVEDHEVHAEDGHYKRRGRFGRFFLFLSLFCFSMLNLLLADNLFQIFVSWELVGICSFLLIGFYFERRSASNAANKAFITNRIGDAGFIVGLLILWTHVGSFNFEEINRRLRCTDEVAHATTESFSQRIVAGSYDPATKKFLTNDAGESGSHALIMPRTPPGHFHLKTEKQADGHEAYVVPVSERPTARQFGVMPYWMLIVAGLGIFLGCVGKSAQFPLQVWLPDAMEGPTPVSALIHAATMVAAGVYLVGRVYPLFTSEVLLTIAYIGMITGFLAASIAVVQTDIKKVLAYSTVSQLGLMMLGLGVGGWSAGLFHLITHACFKALMFLASGSVIYGCHHEQNMLKMGGLYDKMKITAITMLIGCFAISGFPLFSGWYSKDAVLAACLGFSMAHKQHFILFVVPCVGAGLTTFYMFRMWFMTFAGKPKHKHVYDHAHETPWMMTTPLIVLGVLSVCVAWGWPLWDASKSELEALLNLSRPASVVADFGPISHGDHDHDGHDGHDHVKEHGDHEHGAAHHDEAAHGDTPNELTHQFHSLAGNLALVMVILGFAFAVATYLYGVLDPGESQDHFSNLHKFLWHKWYFDEFYSAAIVRPGLVISRWCAAFDRTVVDGIVNSTARVGLKASQVSGKADRGIVDGFVNLLADVFYAVGVWLKNVQTGYLRSYVLLMALAAIGLFALFAAFAGAMAAR